MMLEWVYYYYCVQGTKAGDKDLASTGQTWSVLIALGKM
jgi:hypothetical protein